MDAFLDAIADLVIAAGESWLGVAALTSPIWLLAAWLIRRGLMRRRAFRDFAAARGLEFVGTIASDGRMPYKRVPRVAQAVLLSNVLEGQWEGLPIRLFEMVWRRNGPSLTTILVVVEGRLLRGAGAEGVIAARPETWIEMDLDILVITPQRRLDPSEFAEWLTFAVTLAKAMERDAKEAARFETPAEVPPPRRTMFGTALPD
jgi:hypothetical protein